MLGILFLFGCIHSSEAKLIRPNFGFGHEEALLGSAGLARLGSTGAVLTNPSLLTAHPEKEIFTSTNLIQFYSLKKEENSNIDVPPTIIPLLAGTTKRIGNFAYGYSISSQEVKVNFQQDGQFRSAGQTTNSRISLNGALAYRMSDFSLGIALGLNRETEEARANFFGSSDGFDFVGNIAETTEVWHNDVRIGAHYVLSSGVVIAAGVGIPLILLSSSEKRNELNYSSFDNSFKETTTLSSPRVLRQSVARFGVAIPYDQLKVFLDFDHDLYYRNMDEPEEGNISIIKMAMEYSVEKYRYYIGASFTEAVSGNDSSLLMSSGFSVKHRYAESMYGVMWNGFSKMNAEYNYGIIFGTKFVY